MPDVEWNEHEYRSHECGDEVFLEPSSGNAQLDDLRRQPSVDDRHPRNADRLAEPPRPGAAGIEVEHAVALLDRRLVRVPVHHGTNPVGRWQILEDVEHVDRVTIELDGF